jgi:hypothetical protein
MLGGEVAEGDVREGAHEVQVSDDGEPAAGRGQLAQRLFSRSGGGRPTAEAAHHQEDGRQEDRDQH